MRTKLTLNLKKAICLLFLPILTTLIARAQGTSTFSLPGYTMEYLHDGTQWNHVRNVEFTYNSAGLITESISTSPQTNQNISKSTISYDANGNQRRVTFYQWQNMAWVMAGGSRDSITYNAGNKIIRKQNSIFRNNAWGNYWLEENIYDSLNNLTESTTSTWDTTAWLSQFRYTYTYNANGIITEKRTYFYLNTPFSITQTDSYSAWHIPNSLPAAYTTLITGSQYPDRHTVTMGPNGGYTDVSEYYYIHSNTWGNSNRKTITKDVYGNETNSLNENFDLASNSWQRQAESRNLYTYNSQGDMTQVIRQATDNTSQPNRPVLNIYKLVHSNFQYFNRALGTSENHSNQLNLNVFPNPAQKVLHIEVVEKTNALRKATVFDLAGKVILIQTFKAGNRNLLNVEKLHSGIYLLNLETEKGTTIKKFVKE